MLIEEEVIAVAMRVCSADTAGQSCEGSRG